MSRAQPTLKQLSAKAWRLMSEYSRRKHADHAGMVKCVSCTRILFWREMDAGHFVHGGHGGKLNRVSYDRRNISPQCQRCNRACMVRYGKGASASAHAAYTAHMVQQYGGGIVYELETIKRMPGYRWYEFEQVIEQLKKDLQSLETTHV